jgi:hypothetical protein
MVNKPCLSNNMSQTFCARGQLDIGVEFRPELALVLGVEARHREEQSKEKEAPEHVPQSMFQNAASRAMSQYDATPPMA